MRSAVQSDVRKINSRMFYDMFRKYRKLTRTEIAQKLNMTIPSALKVTQQLVNKRVLIELGEIDTDLGRKPKQFEFNPDFINAIGVSFEGKSMSMGLVNVDGDIVSETVTQPCIGLDENFINSIVSGVECIRSQKRDGALVGVGISIPGIVDSMVSRVEFAPLIGIFEPFDAIDIISRTSERLDLPVIIENDVNMYAKGEFYARRLGFEDDLICITLGTGIGCGIILDGKLRRGKNYLSGEIGYFVNNVNDVTRRDREGYLESKLNIKALESKFSFGKAQFCEDSEMIIYIASQISPHIANISSLLDVDNIVIGGIVTDICGDKLIEAIELYVNRLTLKKVKIEKSVSHNPGVVGSAVMMLEKEFEKYL